MFVWAIPSEGCEVRQCDLVADAASLKLLIVPIIQAIGNSQINLSVLEWEIHDISPVACVNSFVFFP
jgi:hypothetical protein